MTIKQKPNFYQSMGICCYMILDLFKTRLQADSFNLNNFIKNEGITSFWKGIKLLICVKQPIQVLN